MKSKAHNGSGRPAASTIDSEEAAMKVASVMDHSQRLVSDFWSRNAGQAPGTEFNFFDPIAAGKAMMDIGATLCTRSKPTCEDCPLEADCEEREAFAGAGPFTYTGASGESLNEWPEGGPPALIRIGEALAVHPRVSGALR